MASLLSSQAVSAEPAGTITFARFGALKCAFWLDADAGYEFIGIPLGKIDKRA